MLGEEEGLERKVFVDGLRLKQVSKFKYLGCILDESSIYVSECRRKVPNGRKLIGTIKYLANDMGLQLECLRGLFVRVLLYISEAMIWREKN